MICWAFPYLISGDENWIIRSLLRFFGSSSFNIPTMTVQFFLVPVLLSALSFSVLPLPQNPKESLSAFPLLPHPGLTLSNSRFISLVSQFHLTTPGISKTPSNPGAAVGSTRPGSIQNLFKTQGNGSLPFRNYLSPRIVPMPFTPGAPPTLCHLLGSFIIPTSDHLLPSSQIPPLHLHLPFFIKLSRAPFLSQEC